MFNSVPSVRKLPAVALALFPALASCASAVVNCIVPSETVDTLAIALKKRTNCVVSPGMAFVTATIPLPAPDNFASASTSLVVLIDTSSVLASVFVSCANSVPTLPKLAFVSPERFAEESLVRAFTSLVTLPLMLLLDISLNVGESLVKPSANAPIPA